MSAGPPAYFLDAASITQGMIEGRAKRVGYKPERVQEIAFFRTVGSYEKGQLSREYVACGDVLVVP